MKSCFSVSRIAHGSDVKNNSNDEHVSKDQISKKQNHIIIKNIFFISGLDGQAVS
jgi:hypothetical protein